MGFQVQMIGTGSAFAKTYYNNNALVFGDGYTLLIDCGITAPAALHRMSFPLDRIDGVLITHLHADHAGGLEELAFRMRYQHRKKPTLYIAAELELPIWEHSLQAGLKYSTDGHQTIRDWFEVVTLSEGVPHAIRPKLRVELARTQHMPDMPSFSVLLNETLYFSGDTVFDPEKLYRAEERGCTHLFHDCQLEGDGLVHSTLEQLLTLPERLQRKISLMHYGDNMESFVGKTGQMTFVRQQELYSFTNGPAMG